VQLKKLATSNAPNLRATSCAPEDWAIRRKAIMLKGTVKWFNGKKGYGFIRPDDGGRDVFVHISAVEQAGLQRLDEGQKLLFELVDNRKTGKSSAGKLRAS
jgi:cold shock protein